MSPQSRGEEYGEIGLAQPFETNWPGILFYLFCYTTLITGNQQFNKFSR